MTWTDQWKTDMGVVMWDYLFKDNVMGQSLDTCLKWLLHPSTPKSLRVLTPHTGHHRLDTRPPGVEHHKQCGWRGSVLDFGCSFVIHVWPYTYIHTYTYTYIYIYMHTLNMYTVIHPYTHILCLPFTESFGCQTTFISGSSEVMKS
jgi:hypothetical protein